MAQLVLLVNTTLERYFKMAPMPQRRIEGASDDDTAEFGICIITKYGDPH